MEEPDYNKTIKQFYDRLPKFGDGRIDYSESDSAPVINAVLEYQGDILLLKRSQEVANYRGKWNVVGGYLDQIAPLRKKVLEELEEELGIEENDIEEMKYGKPFEIFDEHIKKKWIIYPVLVRMKQRKKIDLDFEHTEYKWIKPDDLEKYDVVFRLEKTLEALGLA